MPEDDVEPLDDPLPVITPERAQEIEARDARYTAAAKWAAANRRSLSRAFEQGRKQARAATRTLDDTKLAEAACVAAESTRSAANELLEPSDWLAYWRFRGELHEFQENLARRYAQLLLKNANI